jgi:hypothetical protein
MADSGTIDVDLVLDYCCCYLPGHDAAACRSMIVSLLFVWLWLVLVCSERKSTIGWLLMVGLL